MTDHLPQIAKRQAINDGLLVYIEHDIDFERSPLLRNELMRMLKAESPVRLVIDLSGVPYIDSSGLATFIETLQYQRRANSKLILLGLQPKVQGMIEIARLDTVFTITHTLNEATEA